MIKTIVEILLGTYSKVILLQ